MGGVFCILALTFGLLGSIEYYKVENKPKRDLIVSYTEDNKEIRDTSAVVLILNSKSELIARGKTDSFGRVYLRPFVDGKYFIYIISSSISQDVYSLSKVFSLMDSKTNRKLSKILLERTKTLKNSNGNVIDNIYSLDSTAVVEVQELYNKLPMVIKKEFKVTDLTNKTLMVYPYLLWKNDQTGLEVNIGSDSKLDYY